MSMRLEFVTVFLALSAVALAGCGFADEIDWHEGRRTGPASCQDEMLQVRLTEFSQLESGDRIILSLTAVGDTDIVSIHFAYGGVDDERAAGARDMTTFLGPYRQYNGTALLNPGQPTDFTFVSNERSVEGPWTVLGIHYNLRNVLEDQQLECRVDGDNAPEAFEKPPASSDAV